MHVSRVAAEKGRAWSGTQSQTLEAMILISTFWSRSLSVQWKTACQHCSMRMENEILRWSITKIGVTKSFSQGKNKCMRDWDEYGNFLLIHCIWLLDVAMSSAGQYKLELDSHARSWRIVDLSLTSIIDWGPNLTSPQSPVPFDLNPLWPQNCPRKRLDDMYFCVADPLMIADSVVPSMGIWWFGLTWVSIAASRDTERRAGG